MTAGTWHVSPTLVERYASGHLDYAAEASLARHLTACEACRADIARTASPPDLAGAWSRVREEIAAPREPWLVRQLRRAGLTAADAVLLSASQALHAPGVLTTATAAAVQAGAIVIELAAATALALQNPTRITSPMNAPVAVLESPSPTAPPTTPTRRR